MLPPPAPRRVARSLVVAWCIAAGPGCGSGDKDNAGDRAMDASFAGGEGSPVHPPRGERKKVRSKPGATTMQSDPIQCTGPGSQTLSNVEMRISASSGAIVRGKCELRLINVDLVAAEGVVVEDGSLIIAGGSITATGVGIRASSTASVELTNVDVSGATGIQAAGEAKVSATKGKITGSGVALALRDQASVVLDQTDLDGPVAQAEGAELTRIEGPTEAGP